MINKKNLSLLALATTVVVPSFFVVSCSSSTGSTKIAVVAKINKDKMLNLVAKAQNPVVSDITKLSWAQISTWVSDQTNLANINDKNFLIDNKILVGGGVTKDSIYSSSANFDATNKSLSFSLNISVSDKNHYFLNNKKETAIVVEFSEFE